MRKLIGLCCVCVCLAGSASALAGEIVQFRDGRFAPIRGHEIDGPWVRLDYGGGYVILPLSRIASIAREHVDTVLYRAPAEVFERLAGRVLATESKPAAETRTAAVPWRPGIRWRSLPPLDRS